jgi:hypothetical protein
MLHNGGQWYCENCRCGAANIFKQNIALTKRVEFLEKQLEEMKMRMELQESTNSEDASKDDKQNPIETASDQTASDQSASDQTAPDQTASDQTASDQTALTFDYNHMPSHTQINDSELERSYHHFGTMPKAMGSSGIHSEDEHKWEEKKSKLCRYYKRNECKFGKKCKFDHPEQCEVFRKNGLAKFDPKGCDGKCKKLHISACKDSLKKGVCDKSDCKFFHTTATKQNMKAKRGDNKREGKKTPHEPTTALTERSQDHFLGLQKSFTQELKMFKEEIMTLIRTVTPQQTQELHQTPNVIHWPGTQAYPGSQQNTQVYQVPRFQSVNQGFYTNSQ